MAIDFIRAVGLVNAVKLVAGRRRTKRAAILAALYTEFTASV
jgi:hypothetical protein